MSPIPPRRIVFPARAFTVAEARANGVSAKRLRARDLTTPFDGIRLGAGWDAGLPAATVFEERCRALAQTLLPEAAFSHLTAATLHRLPLPPGLQNSPLHVSVPRGRRAPHRRGVLGHQTTLLPGDADARFGFGVTTPERTWCDLGAILSLAPLVAVGDRLIHRSLPRTDLDRLALAIGRYGGARGARLLRQALPLLDDGSESPMESWQRVIIVLAGLPTPVTNYEVFDDHGVFVARVDLAYPELKISMDYEGDHHRTDQKQWRRDIARFRRLKTIGWDAKRYTADDLEAPAGFIAELVTAITARS
ncbi:hypothetical protein [Agreia sp.]|uniref:hypothetical protein n=1 Tax=Agreia sp. TaxID=1872416 RepID=UPI0035BBCCE5